MPAWSTGRETETIAQDAAAPATTLDLAAAEDRVLVAAFLAGSQDAFQVIVTRHQRTVYQVCYRFVRNHEDASDLAQDVFVRAFKGLKNFKGDSALSTWLYRVGVNCCLNKIAAKRPDTEPLLEARHVDPRSDDPFRAVARSEKATEVRRAIAHYRPDNARRCS
jgi:RNA polymerase sigma-70 factor (ECF subfamily)